MISFNDPPNKQRHLFCHRLVALAFHGDTPTPTHQVNHKDGNKQNSRPENLEWVTPSQNRQHAWDTGLQDINSIRGEASHWAKYSAATIAVVKRQILRGLSLSTIARHYGIEFTLVSLIRKGTRWAHAEPAPEASTEIIPANRRIRLTPDIIAAIRTMRASGVPGVDVARAFKIDSNRVSRIFRAEEPLPAAI